MTRGLRRLLVVSIAISVITDIAAAQQRPLVTEDVDIIKPGVIRIETGFEFLQNTVLNANTFFNNRNGTPRSQTHKNQFGGTFGGPIRKDRPADSCWHRKSVQLFPAKRCASAAEPRSGASRPRR